MSHENAPGTLVRILNPIDPLPEGRQRRVWLAAGQPAIVGPQSTLTLFQDWGDAGAETYLRLEFAGQVMRMPVEAGVLYDCRSWLGLRVNPVALEYAPGNRAPSRIRVQFVHLSGAVRWAS